MKNTENLEVTQAVSATDPAGSEGGAEYALRKCSFDPKKHLINLENDPNKKPRLYLTVEWRVYWLQVWCQENTKEYLIEENLVEVIPGTSFIQSRCTVYIDGEAVGFGIGGFNLNGSKNIDYCVQTCATIAKGRALANAGFGSVFSSAADSEHGADIPCDSGMGTDFFVFKPQWLGPAAGNPVGGTQPAQAAPVPEPAPAPQPMPASPQPLSAAPAFSPPVFTEPVARKATQVPESDNAPKTREEALKFIVPLRGDWYGHPLAEVLAKSPKDVNFYLNCRNADLRAAAKLVLNK